MSKSIITNKQILDYLEKVLEDNGITKYYYNLDGYSDDKICMEKRDGLWLVYFGWRGKSDNINMFPDVLSASKKLIDELSENEEEANKLFEQLKDCLEIPKHSKIVSLFSKKRISEEEILLCVEHTLLANDVPESEIGLKGFGEDRLCMEKLFGLWSIYFGYHGKRTNKTTFLNIIDASQHYIRAFAETRTQEMEYLEQFKSYIENIELINEFSEKQGKTKKLQND